MSRVIRIVAFVLFCACMITALIVGPNERPAWIAYGVGLLFIVVAAFAGGHKVVLF
jgi:hypothetical protein